VIFEVCIKLYLVKFIAEISKYNFLFDLKKLKHAKTKKAPEKSRALSVFSE